MKTCQLKTTVTIAIDDITCIDKADCSQTITSHVTEKSTHN